MHSFKQYLNEEKNLHLEHIEDEVLNNGVDGTRQAINFLRGLRDMLAGSTKSGKQVRITVKWDGAPAIFAGTNPENNKFFVGTKGVFAKNAKLNYTPEDIDRNHPAEGLNRKLKIALKHLPELNIQGVIQGDMMYTQEDLQDENIDGDDYLIFKPNTIVYAIPKNSDLANQISASQMGIVFHTRYTGDSLPEMDANFDVDVSQMTQTSNVWFRDAEYEDVSGSASMTEKETAQITGILSGAGRLFRQLNPNILKYIQNHKDVNIQIKAYTNTKIREGRPIENPEAHARGLILYLKQKFEKELDKLKTEKARIRKQQAQREFLKFFQTNIRQLAQIFEMQNMLIACKILILRKLEQVKTMTKTFIQDDDGFRVTNPEGFVAVDKLKSDQYVKLVDRLEFSRQNFNAAKNWSKGA
tara:strand:+ start:1633 stop:2871 length:1239 start_codon:yes stop_codon:yes gene_type:complete